MLRIHTLNSHAELCAHLVNRWISVIRDESAEGALTFALAGGTTPGPAYRAFADALQPADLSQDASLQFVATDERWVPDSDPQSNEGLIRDCFQPLSARNIPYQLVSLKTGDPAINPKAVDVVSERIAAQFPQPFTSVILGMGADAHVASIFPSSSAINTQQGPACLAAVHPQTGQERMSLSMHRLLQTKRVWLVITGDEKLRVLQKANDALDNRSPISVLLHNAPCAVDVFWRPN